MILLLIDILSALSLGIILLWVLVPLLVGRPSIPTRPVRIRKALQLASLLPGDTLYDLGAADGRALLIAAQEFGARAVGIEAGLIQSIWIRLRAASSRVGGRIQVRWGNCYKVDLHQADVVFVYAASREMGKLAPYLEQQMKPGARLVSISADFPEWEPSAFDERELIFVYLMPATRGGLTSYLLKKAQ